MSNLLKPKIDHEQYLHFKDRVVHFIGNDALEAAAMNSIDESEKKEKPSADADVAHAQEDLDSFGLELYSTPLEKVALRSAKRAEETRARRKKAMDELEKNLSKN